MKYASPIIRGKGRGKALGFPTINFRIPRAFDFPYGIYAGYVWIGLPRPLGGGHKGRDERQFRAAFHYGPIPTFHSPAPSLEAFVLDAPRPFWDGGHKGRGVEFELLAYLRGIKKFPSPRELKSAMGRDVHLVRRVILLPRRNRAG